MSAHTTTDGRCLPLLVVAAVWLCLCSSVLAAPHRTLLHARSAQQSDLHATLRLKHIQEDYKKNGHEQQESALKCQHQTKELEKAKADLYASELTFKLKKLEYHEQMRADLENKLHQQAEKFTEKLQEQARKCGASEAKLNGTYADTSMKLSKQLMERTEQLHNLTTKLNQQFDRQLNEISEQCAKANRSMQERTEVLRQDLAKQTKALRAQETNASGMAVELKTVTATLAQSKERLAEVQAEAAKATENTKDTAPSTADSAVKDMVARIESLKRSLAAKGLEAQNKERALEAVQSASKSREAALEGQIIAKSREAQDKDKTIEELQKKLSALEKEKQEAQKKACSWYTPWACK